MEGPVVGVYGIIVMFFVLFLLRIPVGFTMALVGFLGFAFANKGSSDEPELADSRAFAKGLISSLFFYQ